MYAYPWLQASRSKKKLGDITYCTLLFPLVVLLIPRQAPNNAFFENLTCGTIFTHWNCYDILMSLLMTQYYVYSMWYVKNKSNFYYIGFKYPVCMQSVYQGPWCHFKISLFVIFSETYHIRMERDRCTLLACPPHKYPDTLSEGIMSLP